MAMFGCLPPWLQLSPSYHKSIKHPNICSNPIKFHNLTRLKCLKENLSFFANELRVMKKVELETVVGCSEPCTQAFYNVKISSSEIADFDDSWLNIAFLDEIQG